MLDGSSVPSLCFRPDCIEPERWDSGISCYSDEVLHRLHARLFDRTDNEDGHFLLGMDIPPVFLDLVVQIKRPADDPSGDSYNKLGFCRYYGIGCSRSIPLARANFLKASRRGHGDGLLNLAYVIANDEASLNRNLQLDEIYHEVAIVASRELDNGNARESIRLSHMAILGGQMVYCKLAQAMTTIGHHEQAIECLRLGAIRGDSQAKTELAKL